MSEWTPELLKQYVDALMDERQRAQETGDAALHKRIDEQIQALRDTTVAQGKQVDAAFAASEKAINKADHAYEKRFEDANEWRGQSADRERSQQDQIQLFRATLLPRETFETVVQQWSEWRAGVDQQLTARASESKGSARTIATIFAAVGFAGTLLGIIIVAANVLTQ